MLQLFNKKYWLGFVSGILFMILSFVALCCWVDSHPATDCDSCIHGTTP